MYIEPIENPGYVVGQRVRLLRKKGYKSAGHTGTIIRAKHRELDVRWDGFKQADYMRYSDVELVGATVDAEHTGDLERLEREVERIRQQVDEQLMGLAKHSLAIRDLRNRVEQSLWASVYAAASNQVGMHTMLWDPARQADLALVQFRERFPRMPPDEPTTPAA